MVPSSRGSAGTVALVFASVFLLLAAWLLAGHENRPVDQAIASLEVVRDPGITGPEASVLVTRADALLHGLVQDADQQVGIVPADTVLAWPASGSASNSGSASPEETRSPPGVADLEGRVEGSSILLAWQAAGDEPAEGYLVERLAPGGEVLSRVEVGPDDVGHRDGPVDALRGIRIYRVTALGHDGTVAGLQQKKISFHQSFTVEFAGATAEGAARFRVNWDRAGQQISEEFDVADGGTIGGLVSGREDRPALDFGTGWRFIGFAGRKKVETREAGVPHFSPDGSLRRDPDTGKAVFEVRKMPVVDVVPGAEVETLRSDGTTGRMWLERTHP